MPSLFSTLLFTYKKNLRKPMVKKVRPNKYSNPVVINNEVPFSPKPEPIIVKEEPIVVEEEPVVEEEEPVVEEEEPVVVEEEPVVEEEKTNEEQVGEYNVSMEYYDYELMETEINGIRSLAIHKILKTKYF